MTKTKHTMRAAGPERRPLPTDVAALAALFAFKFVFAEEDEDEDEGEEDEGIFDKIDIQVLLSDILILVRC